MRAIALMPPTIPDFAGPDGTAVEQLFAKTDWTVGQATTPNYVGQDGVTLSSSVTGLKPFDLRPYREVHLYLVCNSISGGTTPKVYFGIRGYPHATPNATNNVFYTDGQGLGAAGPTATILTNNMTAITNTGVGSINGVAFTAAYKPLFGLFVLTATGIPTTLTVETYVYGIR